MVKGDVQRNYETVIQNELDSIFVPEIIHGNRICCNCNHLHLIEEYYSRILNAIYSADAVLPRCNPSVNKQYWNDELSRLKRESIDAYTLWDTNGRPSSGSIFEIKKNAHYRYKLRLRQMQNQFYQSQNDCLHDHLLDRNSARFWQSWKSIHGSGHNVATRIDGHFRDNDIANAFADSFCSVYQSNDQERVSELKSKFDITYQAFYNEHVDDDISCHFISWDNMLNAVESIKAGKSAAGFIRYEHILHGSPKLLVHLHILYNSLIQHGYVPQDFLSGIITPVVKDAEGDISSTANYRGLTLSVVFASLFEYAILTKIGHLLTTDYLQFGYKAKHSTMHALYTLRSCIDYFTEHGSNVFVAFLDCSKGFDKIDHSGIFIKLMKRGVPLCFLNVVIYWYRNLTSTVRWKNALSRTFHVTSGVRQGGILSPRLFTLYVNDLLTKLRQSGVGCHIVDIFVAALMYADDLALLAPTRSSLQTLLNICQEYGKEWCISYNPLKTNLMVFGKPVDFHPIYLNDVPITLVNECKYLGIHVLAGKEFSTSAKKPLTSFLCSANTILNVVKKPSEQVLMQLLYSNCVPLLTYGCEIRKHTGREMIKFEVALNDCIRKIFTFNRWESTRMLRTSFGYNSVTEIFAMRKRTFERNFHRTGNHVLVALLSTL